MERTNMTVKRDGPPSPSRLVERLQVILDGAFWESKEEAYAAWTAICELECKLDSEMASLVAGKAVQVEPEIERCGTLQ